MRSRELIGIAIATALVANCGNKNKEMDGKTLVHCEYGPKEKSIELQLKKSGTIFIAGDHLTSLGNGSIDMRLGNTIIFEGHRAPSKRLDGRNAYFLVTLLASQSIIII